MHETDDLMDFAAALRLLKAGRRVRRRGWNGKGMWLFLQANDYRITAPNEPTGPLYQVQPSVCMKTAQDTICIGWLASQADMLAEDWEALPDPVSPLEQLPAEVPRG